MYMRISPIRSTIHIWRERRESELPAPACSPSRHILDEEATRRATIAQPASGLHLSMLHHDRNCGYLGKAGQPDANVIEVDPNNPLFAELAVCKKCGVKARREVAELEAMCAVRAT